jgi:hypothetical protein
MFDSLCSYLFPIKFIVVCTLTVVRTVALVRVTSVRTHWLSAERSGVDASPQRYDAHTCNLVGLYTELNSRQRQAIHYPKYDPGYVLSDYTTNSTESCAHSHLRSSHTHELVYASLRHPVATHALGYNT